MRLTKVLLRASILFFSAFCLLIFQLGISVFSPTGSAYANQPFPTVVPVDPDFEDPIDEEIPEPLQMVAVRPGSKFEESDPDRPSVQFTEEGDAEFGYGPMVGDDDLYVVWTTDEDGTHYIVVHKDSALLRGSEDSGTGGRHPNGIDELVRQREEVKQKFVQEVTQAEARVDTSNRSFTVGIGLALVGSAVCIFATLGACAPIVALGGGFLLSAFSSQDTGSTHLAAATDHAEAIETLNGRLNERLENSPQSAVEAPQGGE